MIINCPKCGGEIFVPDAWTRDPCSKKIICPSCGEKAVS